MKHFAKYSNQGCNVSSDGTTTLAISNMELEDTMKLVKSPEDFNVQIKDIPITSENWTKEQQDQLLDMLLGTL